jgi:hypothetical protein
MYKSFFFFCLCHFVFVYRRRVVGLCPLLVDCVVQRSAIPFAFACSCSTSSTTTSTSWGTEGMAGYGYGYAYSGCSKEDEILCAIQIN